MKNIRNSIQKALRKFGYKIIRVYNDNPKLAEEFEHTTQTVDYHAFYHGVDFLCPADSYLGQWVLSGKTWDPNLVSMIERFSRGKQDFVICEIGSNIGASIVPVMVRFPNYHYILIEASPWFFRYLKYNTNKLPTKNLIIYNKLLSDSAEGWATLVENNTTGGRTRNGPYGVNREYHLRTTTLDSLIINNQIDFLKIDTDGFEFPILRGAECLLKRCRPYLLVEFTPDFLKENDEDPQQFLDWLISLGYSRLEVYDNLGAMLGVLSTDEILRMVETQPNDASYVDILCVPDQEN